MSARGIHVDGTGYSVLALCSDCPEWRELRGQRAAALFVGAVHALQVHEDAERARELRRLAREAATRRKR